MNEIATSLNLTNGVVTSHIKKIWCIKISYILYMYWYNHYNDYVNIMIIYPENVIDEYIGYNVHYVTFLQIFYFFSSI